MTAAPSRREFLLVGSAGLLISFAVAAQQKRPVIGLVGTGSASLARSSPFLAAFRKGLMKTGFVEDQNLEIVYRWAENQYDRLPFLVTELVDRNVDVLVTQLGQSTLAAKRATSKIPIVFVAGGDPVAQGLVSNLARPGGNVTGLTIISTELMPKRVDLLADLVPTAKVIGLLVNPKNVDTDLIIHDVQKAAHARGLQPHVLKATNETEISAAFALLDELRAGGLLFTPDPYFYSRRELISALAEGHAIPAVYSGRDYAVAGGLVSYGPNVSAIYHELGLYVARVLKGAKPADLPVQQPTKFELVVNLKTARALGLAVPRSLLARADEVIA